jgi:hypothetical protein
MSPTIKKRPYLALPARRLHQHDIDHRGLVDYQQVAIERIVLATFKATASGSTSSSRWMVWRVRTNRLGHSLGGTLSARTAEAGAFAARIRRSPDDCRLPAGPRS